MGKCGLIGAAIVGNVYKAGDVDASIQTFTHHEVSNLLDGEAIDTAHLIECRQALGELYPIAIDI